MNTDWLNQTILGRFRVDARIPGAGESYRAWDNQSSRVVSLHLLEELPSDEASRQFQNRVRDLERFTAPGTLSYFGMHEFSQHAFWVESYLDGPTLRYVLNSANGQPLPLNEVLTYLKAISAQVTALHAQGWIHADLRPENIRLGRDGKIYLTGLVSARRAGETAAALTPYAPDDLQLAAAFDVYSLARILFELLAGSLPETLPDLRELNPSAPEFLARMLPRALHGNPALRVANAQEFFLTACLACRIQPETLSEQIPVDTDSPSARLLKTWAFLPPLEPPRPAPKTLDLERKRSFSWVWPLVAIVSLGVASVSWMLLQTANPPQSPEPLPVVLSEIPTLTDLPITPVELPTETLVPTLSAPDGLGGRIVFTCTRADLNHLCLIPPTGGQIFQLTAELAHDYYPVFSPDGKMVLYASNRDGNFELFLKLIESSVLVQLTNDLGDVSSGAFSPDGSQIVFSNSVGGAPADLWLVEKDGKNPRMIYDGPGNIASPVFAPNGKSVAFAMSTPEALETYDVYIWDFETQTVGAVTKGRLPNAGGSVDWSPDGRTLLLFAGTSGDHDIFTFEIVSGAVKQLTDGGNNAAPAWSPDGRWIVFNSQRLNENANIYIMKPDGSDVRQLTNNADEPDWQPRWGR